MSCHPAVAWERFCFLAFLWDCPWWAVLVFLVWCQSSWCGGSALVFCGRVSPGGGASLPGAVPVFPVRCQSSRCGASLPGAVPVFPVRCQTSRCGASLPGIVRYWSSEAALVFGERAFWGRCWSSRCGASLPGGMLVWWYGGTVLDFLARCWSSGAVSPVAVLLGALLVIRGRWSRVGSNGHIPVS
jgi:hypothetical protein